MSDESKDSAIDLGVQDLAAPGLPGEARVDGEGTPPSYSRAFSLVTFTMNRFVVDQVIRAARHFDNDIETMILFGTIAHLNVAHLMPPGSSPTSVLGANGRVPDAQPQLRPVRLRDLVQITGRPRETIRRKLERLEAQGRLLRQARRLRHRRVLGRSADARVQRRRRTPFHRCLAGHHCGTARCRAGARARTILGVLAGPSRRRPAGGCRRTAPTAAADAGVWASGPRGVSPSRPSISRLVRQSARAVATAATAATTSVAARGPTSRVPTKRCHSTAAATKPPKTSRVLRKRDAQARGQ